MRTPLLATLVIALLPAASPAQPSAPVVTKTDVIYGRVEGSALLANIAYPDGPALKPAIISVHGGRWRAGNRADASSIKVTQWAEFGFFAMSIDYRLVGGSPAPAPYLDMLCAIRWVHAHAEEYRIDPERVYLIGQSAGGHMVSLMATLGEGGLPRVGGWDKARSDVRAVISVAATYELNTLSWGNLWTPVAGNVEEARRLASPITHVSAATKPLIVIHSDDDKSVPVQQAVAMAAKLKAAGVHTRFVHFTDRGHMGITDEVIKEARAFIAEVEQKKTTPPPIEHDYADVNGVRLHYAKSGSGQLMLFLHGFPEFSYAWNAQLQEFGRDHLAVAPDMRGYNLSSKPEGVEHYRIPLLIEDVRALAAKLGHGANRKFTLVGHDWGGAVAWAYAAAHPETIDKLVIVNAPHPTIFGRELRENPAQQKASAYMLMFRGPDAEKTLSANEHQMLVQAVLAEGLKNGHFTEADKAEYLKAWSQPGALTGGLNYYRAAQVGPPAVAAAPGTEFVPPAMATIKVPTLVIWGEKDTALLTGNLTGLETYVRQLTVRRIPEGSHWVVHEYPALVNQYIRDFLAR